MPSPEEPADEKAEETGKPAERSSLHEEVLVPDEEPEQKGSPERGLLDRAKEAVDDLASKAEPMLEKAREKAGPALDKAREKAGPMIDQAAERADQLVDRSKPAIAKAVDAAEGAIRRAREALGSESSTASNEDAKPGDDA